MTRPSNQPLLAGRTRASPSLNILSSGGDNETLDIGKHRPVNPKAGDVVADNLPDQPSSPAFVQRLLKAKAAGATLAKVTLRGDYGAVTFPCEFIDFRSLHGGSYGD